MGSKIHLLFAAAVCVLFVQAITSASPVWAADRVKEPDVGEVQRAAARFAGFDMGRSSAWQKRASRSGWAPEVFMKVRQENFTNGNEKVGADSPYVLSFVGQGLIFEVGVKWSFGSVVFNKEELSASRESSKVFEDYRRLMDEVGRIYFARRQLAIELASGDQNSDEAMRKRLKMEEHTAMLDALTGGFFTRGQERVAGEGKVVRSEGVV